jgi:hypothetical protein
MTMTIGELITELSKYNPKKPVMFQFKDTEFPIDHVVHNVAEGFYQNAKDEMKPFKIDFGVVLTVDISKYEENIRFKNELIGYANESFKTLHPITEPRIMVSNAMYDKLMGGSDENT